MLRDNNLVIESKVVRDVSSSVVLNKQNLTKHLRNVNKVKYLSYDVLIDAINKIENLKHRMLLIFLANTGLRVSEALNVRKKDVDLSNNTIVVVWLKKRKKQQRVIPINDKLKGVLVFYIAQLKHDDRLFNISRIRAYQVSMFHLGISPHVFRHSFAVHYLISGGRVTDLSTLLGHSSLEVTMIYAKIMPTDLLDEVNKIKW